MRYTTTSICYASLRIPDHVRFPSFDTINAGGFVFSDQFLQISTVLPSQFVYGLGEHDAPFLRNTDWNQFAMWNFDNPPFGDPVRNKKILVTFLDTEFSAFRTRTYTARTLSTSAWRNRDGVTEFF